MFNINGRAYEIENQNFMLMFLDFRIYDLFFEWEYLLKKIKNKLQVLKKDLHLRELIKRK